MASNTSPRLALRPVPAATTASADFSLRVATSAFQPSGEISPGKNALLHRTTAGSTPPRLDHKSFAVYGPLALPGNAFYPVLVHRLTASLHASFPHSVTLMQLRFTSFVVINLRRDFHPQECAHAGRTMKNGQPCGCPSDASRSRRSGFLPLPTCGTPSPRARSRPGLRAPGLRVRANR